MYSNIPLMQFKWKFRDFQYWAFSDEKWSALSIIVATYGNNVWVVFEYFKLDFKFHFWYYCYTLHFALWYYWLSDPLMSTEETSSLIKFQIREFNISTHINYICDVLNNICMRAWCFTIRTLNLKNFIFSKFYFQFVYANHWKWIYLRRISHRNKRMIRDVKILFTWQKN